MSERISSTGNLAREAFRAASERASAARTPEQASAQGGSRIEGSVHQTFEQRARAMLGTSEPNSSGAAPVAAPSGSIGRGLSAVNDEIRAAEALPQSLLAGEIASPAELAAQIKRADLALKFSLEIRNRLVEAYREVMRMTV